jgi:hypothetical protein
MKNTGLNEKKKESRMKAINFQSFKKVMKHRMTKKYEIQMIKITS